MRHIISLLVENHQGVLSRITGLFTGRGYNLESLSTGPAAESGLHRITLVCTGDDTVIEQIQKQLHKLVDVIRVDDLTHKRSMNRELALVKIRSTDIAKNGLFELIRLLGGSIVDVGTETVTLEVTGDSEKLNDVLASLQVYTICEVCRSGTVSMVRSCEY